MNTKLTNAQLPNLKLVVIMSIIGWKSIGLLNVRPLVISYPKREEEKENKVAKPVLKH